MPLRPFPWPDDANARWALLLSLAGSWAVLGLGRDARAAAIVLAALCFFLASEWLSHLSGRSRGGPVPKAGLFHPLGAVLLLGALAGALLFGQALGPLGRLAWQSTAVTLVCLVSLLYILRLEWLAWDGRLIFLSYFLLTLPALFLGFLRWEVGDARAWGFWLPLAAYFPSQALFSSYWLQGAQAPRSASTWLALPVLLSLPLLARSGSWPLGLLLLAFLGRCLQLFLRRRQVDSGLPSLEASRRLAWELYAWNGAFLLAWAWRN